MLQGAEKTICHYHITQKKWMPGCWKATGGVQNSPGKAFLTALLSLYMVLPMTRESAPPESASAGPAALRPEGWPVSQRC